MPRSNLFYRIAMPFTGFALGWCFSEAYIISNKIPKTKQVQQGYIAPSKLEIECKDLDGNGEPETIMRIGDRPLLVKRS